ncbi:hypothetical protein, partial [Microbacterium sp. K41]|uniref:hypothetical protein n=1 Tax=Microbacterium sp. K41 TaxID=2305437 RepID=UPI00197BF1A6
MPRTLLRRRFPRNALAHGSDGEPVALSPEALEALPDAPPPAGFPGEQPKRPGRASARREAVMP